MRGRVLLAAPRSFCAGVDRAIEIVERLLEQHGPPVYVRHQIVHNEHVVRRLEGLGAVFVEDESEIPEGEYCVLSAHGVAPSVKENARARGLRVVDATCPLVNKVHAEARRYADSGHLVALVGHENHVEVIGTLGERPESTIVIESPEQARELQTDKPVAVITQTTLSLDDVAPIVDALEDHLGELRRPHADDICYATQNRQDAVKAMVSEGATLILVIGSETSSNAQRLVEVAQAAGATATLIDGESGLHDGLVDGPATLRSMSRAVGAARRSINLETYRFADDALGRRFAELLMRKQREGVQVNLIYDSFGSLDAPPAFFERMRASGIRVVEFNPLDPLRSSSGWDPNSRDHRKLLIVDGRTVFTGGVNVSGVYATSSFARSRSRLAVADAITRLPDGIARLTVWDGWRTIPLGWGVLGALGVGLLVLLVRRLGSRGRTRRRSA